MTAISQDLSALGAEQRKWLKRAQISKKNGWNYVKVEGTPYQRGYQHGYLTVEEFRRAINAFTNMTYLTTGKDYQFFVDHAVQLHKQKIPVTLLEEMQGLADGYTQAGMNTSLEDIIGWNAYMEMTEYWWPQHMHEYTSLIPGRKVLPKGRCSAFIATGSATTDGRIVVGHESFTEFWNGQFSNIILDLTPFTQDGKKDGSRIIMQTCPGYVASMTDFYVTEHLVVTETTIVGFSGYKDDRVPEYVRARQACQYAEDIDTWIVSMNSENNGGYANMWLLGDLKTNEIAKFEQGLLYQNNNPPPSPPYPPSPSYKKKDGCFFGENAPDDPRIRYLECADTGYDDIRQQTGARRKRWPQLLEAYKARKIDVEAAKTMLGDTYDVYLKKDSPSSRTICAHYDEDPQYYASDPNGVWNIPFYPAGSVDGKVTTAALAEKMQLWGRFGRADGKPFEKETFLSQHTQWEWQRDYLSDFPHEEWALFPS